MGELKNKAVFNGKFMDAPAKVYESTLFLSEKFLLENEPKNPKH